MSRTRKPKQRSPSERLRAVFFQHYKQEKQNVLFEEYYDDKMEMLIEHYKSRLQ